MKVKIEVTDDVIELQSGGTISREDYLAAILEALEGHGTIPMYFGEEPSHKVTGASRGSDGNIMCDIELLPTKSGETLKKFIITGMETQIEKAASVLTNGLQELKEKQVEEENLTDQEDKLLSDYYSWDKGDCSGLGLIAIVFKFMLANELLDEYTYRDVKKIKSLIDALDKGLD